MSGPLSGVRVLDLSRVVAGPYCAMLLGDLGAEVIKVEQPGSGDECRGFGPPYLGSESLYYLALNRNKRGITVNLHDPRGQRIVRDLARRSDILIENFRLGGLERLGLGYADIRALNPASVYCSISGYGPDGPYADRPGYDLVVQGMSGIMSLTGEPDGEPQRHGLAIADLTTGMMASTATLAALHHARATGAGQHVHVSLLESVLGWLTNRAAAYLNTGEVPTRMGNEHPSVVPYQVFQAQDRPMVLTCGNDRQFGALCRVLGQPEWADDPRFATNRERVRNRAALTPLLAAVFLTRAADVWAAELLAAGVPAGPINTLDQVFSDPQVLAREMLAEVPHPTLGTVRLAGIPMQLSETPPSIERHPPLLGEHTDEVLREVLGLSPDEVAALRAEGAI